MTRNRRFFFCMFFLSYNFATKMKLFNNAIFSQVNQYLAIKKNKDEKKWYTWKT